MEKVLVVCLIVVLTCFDIQAVDLLLSSSQKGFNPNITPCLDDTDCDEFSNSKCVEQFCQCNNTRFCEEKFAGRVIVTKIGETCKINADCNIEHSVCNDGKCACGEGRVGASDGRKCLKLTDALGSTCEESIQCYMKVPHSGCQNEKCVCQQQMHEYDGVCYRNVALGEQCQLTGECSATIFAKCTDQKCTCKEGYVPNRASNRCLDVATKIGGPCYEDNQCSAKFGKAYCKQGHCHCVELYQFKFSKSMCVRDMLLGETCHNHTECHGPEEGESRSECILGVCKCRSEFYEEHGFCTSLTSKQFCIDLSACKDINFKKNLYSSVSGRCECQEERPYCTSSVPEKKTFKFTQGIKKSVRKKKDDDIPPRTIREVMISSVFWTYNIFLYCYWQTETDEDRRILRKYTFPFLVLFFHGFTECNIYHICISEILVVFGMLFRAIFI